MRTPGSVAFAVGLILSALTTAQFFPATAQEQSTSRVAEAHYEKARAFYKAKPPDFDSAAAWYQKAAEQGHAAAQNDLGWLYQNGWGVPQDFARAVDWYRQAATQGNVVGQVNLGAMYQNARGVRRDYAEAAKWYRLAAIRGSPIGADNLGVLYRDGLGVPRDYAEAVAWFRKAAAAGLASGQTDLGWMYQNGWGVPRDYVEAMKWYRLAAAQGDALAQNNIGVMYRDSLGVHRDLDQALAWFRKAAAGGEPRARHSLRHLQALDRGMDPWLNIFAGQDVGLAVTKQGLVYLYGIVSVRLPPGKTLEVKVPAKILTDPELRDLGILQPNGSIVIKHPLPPLPYKPLRTVSGAQQRLLVEQCGQAAISIHWPPYMVIAQGVEKLAPGAREAVRETIERLYEM